MEITTAVALAGNLDSILSRISENHQDALAMPDRAAIVFTRDSGLILKYFR
jgi:hypothetical protein